MTYAACEGGFYTVGQQKIPKMNVKNTVIAVDGARDTLLVTFGTGDQR